MALSLHGRLLSPGLRVCSTTICQDQLEFWRGHVSFGTVAKDVGLGDFWDGGSNSTLDNELARQSGVFRFGENHAKLGGVLETEAWSGSATPK